MAGKEHIGPGKSCRCKCLPLNLMPICPFIGYGIAFGGMRLVSDSQSRGDCRWLPTLACMCLRGVTLP